jgi:hypothetical protein
LLSPLLVSCWQLAGELMDHPRHVIGCHPDMLHKESVDLSSQQEDHREVVKEKQKDNNEPRRPYITLEKVGDIEREQREINLEQDRRYYGSQPTLAKTNALIGHHDVDGLKQDPRDTQGDENTK